jgi:hypothetical protein
MTNNKNIIASNSLVLVNTAIDSNAIVLLSNTSFGSIVNVRDQTGNVRSNIPIYVSTVKSVNFTNTADSNFLIQQPFGSLSFAATGSNSWSVLNTFAFNTPTPTAVSTPVINISSILFKHIGTAGRASVLNISSFLQLDASNVGGSGGGDSEPVVVPDPLVQQSIFASTITVSGSNVQLTPTKSYSFYVTGVANPNFASFSNIRISQDSLSWANFSVEFTNGFGTDIKTINNYIVFAGFANITSTSTDLQIHFIVNNSVQTRNIYPIGFEVSSNAFLKYEQGSDGYHSILFNDVLNETTILLYTSNIETTSTWSENDDSSITNLFGTATSFITANNYYVLCGGNTECTFSNIESAPTSLTSFTQSSGFDTNLFINKIVYSPVDDIWLINGKDTDAQQRTYWSDDGKIWATQNDAIPPGAFAPGFIANDIYINQGTSVEEGLPRIVYVGTNLLNPFAPIVYYSYEQDIKQQSNFHYIVTNPGPGFISGINSISLQLQFGSNSLWIATNSVDAGSSQLTVDNFLQSNITVKLDNGLSKTNSIVAPYIGLLSIDSNTRVETSGTLKTSFVTFSNSDTGQAKNQSLSASNRTLYRNTYPINPVGGFIEFLHNPNNDVSLVSYPLCIGTLGAFSNGWWPTNPVGDPYVNSFPYVFGFTTLPGYSLLVRSGNNLTGTILYSNTNLSLQPIYLNVFNSGNTFLSASYRLSPVI